MDQISGLPDAILHDILSRLSDKDAARTNVLSKAWRETWSTFPILSFFEHRFVKRYNKVDEDFLRERKIYIDYVKKTLLRFRDQGLAIKEFTLNLINCDQHNMSRNIDLWMKLAVDSCVKDLRLGLLDCFMHVVDPWCTFPQGVLEAKSLEKLVLRWGIRFDQIVLNHSIQDFSLRVLSLEDVLLGDEGIIEHLISRCPLIEQITLRSCHLYDPHSPYIRHLPVLRTLQLKSLSMNGLKKLKGVDIRGIQEVYIDAPNLENLLYCPDMGFSSSPFELNINNCRNLRRLELSRSKDTVIEDKWLLQLFSNSPFLERLGLYSCSMSERINISSAQLKVLELSHCPNLKEVNIDAPNLLLLSFGCCDWGDNIPVVSFLRSSSKLEVKVGIYMDFSNRYKLREIIQNFKPHKVLTLLSLFILGLQDIKSKPDVLKVAYHLPIVKHLHIDEVPKNEALYLPLVNCLLSSCCPETISFSLRRHYCCEAFAEFFWETLMGRNRNKCYCSSGHNRNKCWWHDLKIVSRSVKTVYSEMTALCAEEAICFQLEL